MQRVRELEQRLAASLPREECDALAAELAATKEAAAVAQASFEAALVLAAEAQTQAVETARAEAAQAQAQAVEEARAQAMEEARARLPPLSPDACGKVREHARVAVHSSALRLDVCCQNQIARCMPEFAADGFARQSALLAELSAGASLVPDSPGPLSVLRSLRPDRHAAAAAGHRRRWLASPAPFARPEAAGRAPAEDRPGMTRIGVGSGPGLT